MRPSARRVLLWALLLGAAFGVRVAAALWWEARLPPGMRFGFGDSESYWALAGTIARGEPYRYGEGGPRVFRTPGYPLVLAPLFWLYGGEPPTIAARVLGAALGTATVACVAALARACFDARAAALAAAMATFDPGAIAMSVFLLSEAPFCPLMLLQLIAWVHAWKAERRLHRVLWSLAGGVFAGGATLMRPSWLLFTPFAAAVGLSVSPPRKRQGEIGALMLVALAATMAPWWVRNYAVTGHFVPTTLQVGASLYDGLSPHATGASDMRYSAEQERAYLESFPPERRPAPADVEWELDRHLRDAAIAWARQHPDRAWRLVGVKLVRMWNLWPNAEEFRSQRLRLIVAVAYAPVLALALWGAWRLAPRGWPCLLCLAPAVYLTLLHVIFVASIRYRQPPMLALMALAAGVVWRQRPANGE